MARSIKLVVYPVKDMAKAKAVFSKFLAAEPYIEGEYYAGYRVGELEIGLDPNGHSAGPIGYVDVTDLQASLKELLDAGAVLEQDAKDVGGGMLIAQVKDPDGHTLGLRQSPKS